MTTLPFFLAVALKGAVVLSLAGLAALLLRRAPASARHGVWAAAFCGLLLLPVLEAVGPTWAVSVLPASGQMAPLAPMPPAPPLPPLPPAPPAVVAFAPGDAVGLGGEAAAFEAEIAAFEAEMEGFAAEAAALASEQAALDAEAVAFAMEFPGASASRWDSPIGWIVGLWGLGALAVALGWVSAFLSARRLVRMAVPEVDEEWAVLAERARRLSGLPERVRLLRSDHLDVPIAWGYGRPAVVLPASSDTWTTDRREAVLLHEMAHLRRHDAWTQVLAQAAVALHWANPLAWIGYRRFLDAREQACDDAVLQGGARPSAYAQHLVGVARSLRRDRLALAAVAPMARCVPLESRVRSILDVSRRRSRLGQPTFARATALTLVALVPLAALRPVAAAQEAPDVPRTEAQALADTEAPHVDFDVTHTEAAEAVASDATHAEAVEARLSDLHARLAELQALAERDEVDVDLSDLEGLKIDLNDLEIDIDLSDLEDIEYTVEALRTSPVRFVRVSHVEVEHDADACPEEAPQAPKKGTLAASVAEVVQRSLMTSGFRAAEAGTVAADARAQMVDVESIAVQALEREAQLAAAEARRHAESFMARGSTPPPPAPRRVRSAPRAPAAPAFDWDAVDRARRAALRRHAS